MLATERRARIAASLAEEGRVRVSRAAETLGVSEETVRRDLDALAEQGIVRRVHGGAVPSGALRALEAPLSSRLSEEAGAKARIAARALELLPREGSILLDAGSSTLALAELLALEREPRALEVITNSLPAACALAGVPGVEVEVLGGRVRGITQAVVGPEAVERLATLRVDLALLGANGVTAARGCSTPDGPEAATKRALAGAGAEVALLADATKFGRDAVHAFAPLDALDVLVTDGAPEAALAEALRAAGVEVALA